MPPVAGYLVDAFNYGTATLVMAVLLAAWVSLRVRLSEQPKSRSYGRCPSNRHVLIKQQGSLKHFPEHITDNRTHNRNIKTSASRISQIAERNF